MKLNSRLRKSDLYAAGATTLLSAALIAGCATGERTGKFWDKSDVNSSDAYVAAERARDQSTAAKTNSASGTGKIAMVSGTQDSAPGHAALTDFPDPPPAPPAASATTTSRSDAGRVVLGGALAGSAEAATAAAGGAPIAANPAPGSIVAPYVQKRPPSGVVDNKRFDGEIVKPKSVYARQLDPFAATDAGPPAPRPAAQTVPPVAAGPPIELVPNDQPSAPAVPFGAGAQSQSVGSFTPYSPPTAPSEGTTTSGPPPVPPQATVEPAETSAPPADTAQQPATGATPARRHSGIRLGDENLNEDQSPVRSDETQVVESAAAQAPPETQASPPTNSYESDVRHEASPSTCVTTPPATKTPANATAPPVPSPVQDTWESARTSRFSAPPSDRFVPLPAPAGVTSVAPIHAGPIQAERAPAPRDSVLHPAAPLPTVPMSAAPARAPFERESVAAPKASIDRPKTGGGSGPMICDSASVHGRYTGDDNLKLAPAVPDPFDVLQKPRDGERRVPASSASPSTKKPNPATGGKSTSFWDDAFNSPSKHVVSTADFSVPAPLLPLDADDVRSAGKTAPQSGLAVAKDAARHSRHSRSRAWLAIGLVAVFGASILVWRRRNASDAALTDEAAI